MAVPKYGKTTNLLSIENKSTRREHKKQKNSLLLDKPLFLFDDLSRTWPTFAAYQAGDTERCNILKLLSYW